MNSLHAHHRVDCIGGFHFKCFHHFLSLAYVSCRRGLNPPHRVKSISMTTFSQQEVEFLQNHGNEVSGSWSTKQKMHRKCYDRDHTCNTPPVHTENKRHYCLHVIRNNNPDGTNFISSFNLHAWLIHFYSLTNGRFLQRTCAEEHTMHFVFLFFLWQYLESTVRQRLIWFFCPTNTSICICSPNLRSLIS